MAHPNPTVAALQTRAVAGPKVVNVPITPTDSKAIASGVAISDPALSRKIAYASKNSITVALTDDEMKALMADIARGT
jgi:hypothetical protein